MSPQGNHDPDIDPRAPESTATTAQAHWGGFITSDLPKALYRQCGRSDECAKAPLC